MTAISRTPTPCRGGRRRRADERRGAHRASHQLVSEERGAVSLEWIGLLVVAALTASLVLAAVSSPQVSRAASNAVCRIFTFGSGSCSGGASPFDTAAGLPQTPCVSAAAYPLDGRVGIDNYPGLVPRAISQEQLSNGQQRIRVINDRGGVLESGTGGGSRSAFTDDIFGPAPGPSTGSDGGGSADGSVRSRDIETYVVNSADASERLVSAMLTQSTLEAATSGTTVSSGLMAPLVEWFTDRSGAAPIPPPTSLTTLAGMSARASSWVSPVTDGGAGPVGPSLLGMTTHDDGRVTIHSLGSGADLPPAGPGGVAGSPGPTDRVQIDTTFDGARVSSVSVIGDSGGTDAHTRTSWTLPVISEDDRRAVEWLLGGAGAGASSFFAEVRDHGEATRVFYAASNAPHVDVGTTTALLTGAGIDASGALLGEDVVSAEYFNGRSWAPWDACAG